ncbi:MAG: glycoside hydrolase family 3 N-terminal domain-containing protein, partial [Anaerolineae bacterium]
MALPPAGVVAQGDAAVRRVVQAMSPAEKVAQLFLVPIDGGQASLDGDAAHLVRDIHVGGVYLDPTRGNFGAGPNAPAEVARFTAALQSLAAGREPYVPLLIALAQKGGGFPDSPLVGGVTPLPSPMALGATWRPEQAEGIGELVGRELAAVGVNLLLAPDLDVLAVPLPGGPGDRGVSSFGGSPQWVGRLGARYVAGVHTGGRGRVATAVGHFPGIGGADRSPEEEVAVVEKTFQELAATELVPYEAVAGGGRPGSRTDALVTSHVRYRGVQQQLDRPLSLDSGGLRYLWAQVPALDSWRSSGGVLVSPDLGLPAVRRYDDPNLGSFNHRRVIREALAAGHDVLFVANLDDGTAGSDLAAVDDGISWLATVYGEDEAVRAAVDAAVVRVVALKTRLYPDFRLEAVAADPEVALRRTGVGTEEVRAVARDALTRLAPAGGGAPAPGSPKAGDRVLLVVDARPETRCRGCDPALSLDPKAMVAITRRTYGRAGAHRVGSRLAEDCQFPSILSARCA